MSPKPTLVLLPGLDGTGQLFDAFVNALGTRAAVHIVRYPTSKSLGYEELERLVRAQLPSREPFFLLGESFSGPIAISIAASNPPLLKGIILCCSFASNPRPLFTNLKSVATLLPIHWAPRALLSYFLLGRFATGKWETALSAAIAQVAPSALRARLQAVLSVDVSQQLSSPTTPILYLRAKHDRLVPQQCDAHISRLAPQARIVEIESPHCLLQIAPEEAAKAVATFIAEIHNSR